MEHAKTFYSRVTPDLKDSKFLLLLWDCDLNMGFGLKG